MTTIFSISYNKQFIYTYLTSLSVACWHTISNIFKIHNIKTEIICASVRNPIHIIDCALAGADIATVPYKVIEQCIKHPLTDAGIEKFKKDYIAVFGE